MEASPLSIHSLDLHVASSDASRSELTMDSTRTPLLLSINDDIPIQSPSHPARTASASPRVGREYYVSSVAMIFLVPALGGTLYGYDIGSTSYSILQMQQDVNISGVWWSHAVANSAAIQGIIVAAASVGAFLGSVMVYNVADVIGRKRELQAGAFLYFIGAIVQFAAGTVFAKSAAWIALTVLMAGRILYGIGIGFAMHAAPTYLGEMSPSSIRGFLVSMKEVFIVLGMLLGYVAGFGFSKSRGAWTYSYLFSTLLSLPMLFTSFVIPRSCRWLVLVGRRDEALKSLQFIFVPGYAEEQFESMAASFQSEEQHSTSPFQIDGELGRTDKASIWDPSCRAQIIAGIGLVVLQQVTGQPSVLSYATLILHDAGLSDFSSILVGVIKLLATIGAAATVEKLGRKKLLFYGITAMFVSLVILAFETGNAFSERVVLISMFCYIGGYQFSFGPITWLILSEVFPLNVRGQAVAFGGQVNFALNALVQFCVPLLGNMIGFNVTFGIFAALAAYSLFFVKMFIIETKGLTLEQIEEEFQLLIQFNRGDASEDQFSALAEEPPEIFHS